MFVCLFFIHITCSSLLQDSLYQTLDMKQNENDNSWHSGEVQQIDSIAGIACDSQGIDGSPSPSVDKMPGSSSVKESKFTVSLADPIGATGSVYVDSHYEVDEARNDGTGASSSGSPWYQLRKEATAFVSQTLQRGRKNLWQLTTSRLSVLLSSAAVGSTSIHQFLKNYEDLNVFILAGEAFCGAEALEFRQKLKVVCENYFLAFHRQNIHVSCCQC